MPSTYSQLNRLWRMIMSRKLKSLFTASAPMRLFMFNASLIILVGIWLTGFDIVHWSLYLVPAFFIFAAATGLCLGLAIPRIIFERD